MVIINDLPNSSSLFKFILFADDSLLSTSFAEETALDLYELLIMRSKSRSIIG